MKHRAYDLIFYVCTIVYVINWRQALAANDTTDNGDCSNHCAQDDKDDTCWRKTEHYYDQNLISALNDWVTVQINIDQWNRRHDVSSPNDTDVVSRLSAESPSGSVVDATHLQEIAQLLMNLTRTQSPSIITVGIPEFVCPTPCNYDSKLWEYLFIASILVNIAMLLVVIPFIIKSERRDKKLYAKQVSMMQMLKPTSKSRNPSSS